VGGFSDAVGPRAVLHADAATAVGEAAAQTCARYNVVRWGKTELPPQAGVAVYVRGQSGMLAAARIYDDVNPPLGSPV